MTEITVRAERDYAVKIVENWADALQSSFSDRRKIFIAPRSLAPSVVAHFPDSELISVTEGENQKNLDSYASILEQLAAKACDRATLLIGVGGGATTDLTGFLAATYLRGVEWVAIPTSVAGMVDAAIGGKTAINLEAGKNLVGAFYSPSLVVVDTEWLKTLPERDINAGLAESLKCGFIVDTKILALMQSDPRSNLNEIIERSIKVKADIVSRDFKESGEREILNYGHTLGHAIEAHSNYQMRHGEAIAVGLVFAAEVSARYSGLSYEEVALHRELVRRLDLPTSYQSKALPELMEYMKRDKKRKGDSLRFVTLSKPAVTSRVELTISEVEKIFLETISE